MEEIIQVKEEVVVDSFTIQELKNHISDIEGQMAAEKLAYDLKILALEDEKKAYEEKIDLFSKK